MKSILPEPRRNKVDSWKLTREKILMFSGLALIAAEFVNAELFGGTFHIEFLLIGGALCGVSISRWGDRGDKSGGDKW